MSGGLGLRIKTRLTQLSLHQRLILRDRAFGQCECRDNEIQRRQSGRQRRDPTALTGANHANAAHMRRQAARLRHRRRGITCALQNIRRHRPTGRARAVLVVYEHADPAPRQLIGPNRIVRRRIIVLSFHPERQCLRAASRRHDQLAVEGQTPACKCRFARDERHAIASLNARASGDRDFACRARTKRDRRLPGCERAVWRLFHARERAR